MPLPRATPDSLTPLSEAKISQTLPRVQRNEDSGLPKLWDEEATEQSTRMVIPAAVRSRPKPRLTFMTGSRAGEFLSLEGRDQTVIGRAQTADLCIEDSAVSREHCRIRAEGDAFVIEDMGSSNGTWLNGESATRSEVRVGDRIQLGPTVVLQFGQSDETEDSLQRRLYSASTRDPLTGLYNRHFLLERFAVEIAHAIRQEQSLALMLIDVDHFKRVNDTLGHAMGDAVLREIARALSATVRRTDTLARYGGEEFVVLARAAKRDHASSLAERLRDNVSAARMLAGDGMLSVTVSVGVAELSECDTAADASVLEAQLFRLADERLYRAKDAGRNRVCAK